MTAILVAFGLVIQIPNMNICERELSKLKTAGQDAWCLDVSPVGAEANIYCDPEPNTGVCTSRLHFGQVPK